MKKTVKVIVTETTSGNNFTQSFSSKARAEEYAKFVNGGKNLKAEIVK